ncbi:MAG: tetratricopeptide repeat protein, partial [Gammaproteobacteria bacterium]|nr:tetratricopeptide repeat protein [Gammaproteobacteria bacterium]
QPAKQKELLERALVIKEHHYGPDHYEVARTVSSLGNAFGLLGQPAKQKELLESVLPIFERHYGSDHEYVRLTHTELASAYGALGQPDKQQEMLNRAQENSCAPGVYAIL